MILMVSLFNSCSLDFDLDIPVPCLFCYEDPAPIEKGLITVVSGKAYDHSWNRPIVGVKVYLEHVEAVGYRKSTYIDSTLTDSNGNYTLSFTTDGVAFSYYVTFRTNHLGPFHCYSSQYEIQNFGDAEIFNFEAVKLNIAKIKIHMIDNPNPPLRVYTNYSWAFIYEHEMDTITSLLVKPNTINQLYFNITNPDSANLYNYRIDTINLIGNFKDTVLREYTVRPKEFKKRG